MSQPIRTYTEPVRLELGNMIIRQENGGWEIEVGGAQQPRWFAAGESLEGVIGALVRTVTEDAIQDEALAWEESVGYPEDKPPAILEKPCVHEWFEGRCVHCEITPKDFRGRVEWQAEAMAGRDRIAWLEQQREIALNQCAAATVERDGADKVIVNLRAEVQEIRALELEADGDNRRLLSLAWAMKAAMRQLWELSQRGDMVIRVAGDIQAIVEPFLDGAPERKPLPDVIDDMRQNPSRFLRRAAEITGLDKCEYCKGELSDVEIDKGKTVCGQCRVDIAESSDMASGTTATGDGQDIGL